ncbi:MAG: tyrosine-type recombinase/integrase [Candidatus Heimdallarchaeaceae archaeon]|jgi:site-specific recombinase XerD
MSEDIVDKQLKVKNRKNLFSEEQIDLFRKFDQYIVSRKNIRETTREHQLSKIMLFAEELGRPFENVTKDELMNYLSQRQKRNKPATLEQMKCLIKKFYVWMDRKDIVSWIKLDLSAYKKEINPKDLWSWKEIKQFIKAFSTTQHQALATVLMESEARISELISMNICDVTDLGGDVLEIYLRDSKTQKRPIKLTHSVIYLRKWLEAHPYKNNPDHALWISNNDRSKGERLKATSVNEMFHSAQKRCGIDKKITPHLLRHSMCSYLRRKGYPDADHLLRMGVKNVWVLERYSHISQEQANNEYLKLQGVKVKEEDDDIDEIEFKPIKCWKCGIENTPTANYCSMCTSNLTLESAERDFTIMELLKTKFTDMDSKELEKTIIKHQQDKEDINNLINLLNCFNGTNEVSIDKVRSGLGLKSEDALHLLQILMTDEIIELKYDSVVLLDRQKLQDIIQYKKKLET